MISAPPEKHFFRHEYGRLVAMLSRRMGVQHLQAIEDAVQSALLAALESWTIDGMPDNPSAWLFRVAHNHVAGELRRGARRDQLLERSDPGEPNAASSGPKSTFEPQTPR